MDIKLVKLELIEQILSTESIEIINEVKALLNQSDKPALTDEHYKILEERALKYSKSKESFTWDEVKANAKAAKS